MPYTLAELKVLAAKATTLKERLNGLVQPIDSSENKTLIKKRINRWRQTVTGGHHAEAFAFRLAQDKINEVKVKSFLGKVVYSKTLPEWVHTLNEILEGKDLSNAKGILDKNASIPFAESLLPFVAYAQDKMKDRKKIVAPYFSPQAWHDLERGLLVRLSSLAAMAFWEKFRQRQPIKFQLNLFLDLGSKKPTTKKIYNDFVNGMLKGELQIFFKEYAVLGRLLVTMVQQWIESVHEFLERLKKDQHEIKKTFAKKKSLGKVLRIQANLSDPHHGGRMVYLLEFEKSVKLLYKPKNVVTEEAFFSFIEWLNKQRPPHPLKVLKRIIRRQYGWVEFAETRPCQSKEEAKNYFYRAGMLLGLLYLFDATDAHAENVIPNGDSPVFIDLEALMQPQRRAWNEKPDKESATFFADQKINQSVLRTGMLPVWIPGREGQAYDISPLTAEGSHRTGYQTPVWKKINTDQMHLVQEESILRFDQHAPKLKKKSLSGKDYQKELIEGFTWIYRFLLKNRKRLFSKKGPLHPLSGCPVRFIYRPTNVYALLGLRLLHPDYLIEGVDRSIEIEVFTRNLIVEKEESTLSALKGAYEAERMAFERLDTPCFFARPNELALKSDGDVIANRFFQEKSFNQVLNRLRKLDEGDLNFQIRVIRASLLARYAEIKANPASSKKEPKFSKPLSKEKWVDIAITIANDLEKQAIRGKGGDLNWLSLGFHPLTEKMQLMPVAESFYDGRCGIALFFAALYKITKEKKFQKMAVNVFYPLQEVLQDKPKRLALIQRLGIGGTDGAGGFIYGCVKLSELLGEKAYIKEAELLLDTFSDDQIKKDEILDVSGGAAGAILGLISLYKGSKKKDQVLAKALACGEHLLKNRSKSRTGHKVWVLPGVKLPLTGMSHGTAGIALALLRLYKATKEKKYLEAAKEALDFETASFLEKEKNWPDYREKGKNPDGTYGCMTSWCHGAPGIGLARLSAVSILETPQIKKDIEKAIQTTLKGTVLRYDHVCCGTFGRMELLLEAAQKLNRPQLLEEAQKRGTWSMRRAQKKGGWLLIAALDGTLQSPSLFQGTSGIGYQCLRLAYPEKLPSLLSWQ